MSPRCTARLVVGSRVVLLDGQDLAAFSSYSWFLLHGRPYASIPGPDGRRHLLSLARAIAQPAAGLCVAAPRTADPDAPLDLRRHRLALLTRPELARVSAKRKGTSSVYRGVSFVAAKGRYRALVWHRGKVVHAGYFGSRNPAAARSPRRRPGPGAVRQVRPADP